MVTRLRAGGTGAGASGRQARIGRREKPRNLRRAALSRTSGAVRLLRRWLRGWVVRGKRARGEVAALPLGHRRRLPGARDVRRALDERHAVDVARAVRKQALYLD